MTINTERLELTALTARQLELWINDMTALETELEFSYCAEPMCGIFKEIVQGQLRATQNDRDNYMWHSFWLIIRKSDRICVGSADFKGTPDVNGEVEIGYGLGAQFEHNGYMTETVRAMCGWAEGQPGVSHIIAETDIDGVGSQRVLEGCGFHEYARQQTVWYRR